MTLDLAFDSYGDSAADGPAVVVLHGLLGQSRNWTTIARRLALRHRVLAVDLRNHGRSPWAEEVGYPAMAADVARLIRREAGGRAAVVGHSMGGKVAMTLALAEPGLVDRLVVVDIAPVAYQRGFVQYLEAMRGVDLAAATSRAEIDQALAAAVPDPGVRAFLLQNLERADAGFRWRPHLDALARNMDRLLGFPASKASYPGPTLVIRGLRSDYVQPAHREAFARLFPAVRHVAVRDAGHWVHAEQPERFQAVLEPFLDAGQA